MACTKSTKEEVQFQPKKRAKWYSFVDAQIRSSYATLRRVATPRRTYGRSRRGRVFKNLSKCQRNACSAQKWSYIREAWKGITGKNCQQDEMLLLLLARMDLDWCHFQHQLQIFISWLLILQSRMTTFQPLDTQMQPLLTLATSVMQAINLNPVQWHNNYWVNPDGRPIDHKRSRRRSEQTTTAAFLESFIAASITWY